MTNLAERKNVLYRRVSGFESDRKSTRLNSSHSQISYAVFCLKKKKEEARRLGVQTVSEFFNEAFSNALALEDRQSRAVLARNVYAHDSELKGFAPGIRCIIL